MGTGREVLWARKDSLKVRHRMGKGQGKEEARISLRELLPTPILCLCRSLNDRLVEGVSSWPGMESEIGKFIRPNKEATPKIFPEF